MTIADVSRKFDFSPDTLRYYERIGLLPEVNRKESGVRDYTEEDLRWVEFIKCMRGAGLPIEMLIDYIKLFKKGDKTIAARKDMLIEQRDLLKAKIDDLQSVLEKLNHKIEIYEERLVEREKTLLEKKNKK